MLHSPQLKKFRPRNFPTSDLKIFRTSIFNVLKLQMFLVIQKKTSNVLLKRTTRPKILSTALTVNLYYIDQLINCYWNLSSHSICQPKSPYHPTLVPLTSNASMLSSYVQFLSAKQISFTLINSNIKIFTQSYSHAPIDLPTNHKFSVLVNSENLMS